MIRATTKSDQVAIVTTQHTESASRLQSNERNEKADACTSCEREGLGNIASEPLSDTEDREEQEDPPFEEYGGKGFTICYGTGAVEADDRECKVCIHWRSRISRYENV